MKFVHIFYDLFHFSITYLQVLHFFAHTTLYPKGKGVNYVHSHKLFIR